MFHDIKRIGRAAEEELCLQRPDLVPMACALRRHLEQVHTGYHHQKFISEKVDADMHAVLCVMLSPDFEKARIKICAERNIVPNGVEASVFRALNASHPVLAPHTAELAEKGVVFLRDSYFRLDETLRAGSAFSKLCRMIKPEFQAALEEAMYRALKNGNKALSRTQPFGRATLPYIALRLAADGAALANFLENKITFGVAPETLHNNIRRTAAAIDILENIFDIKIAEPPDAGADWRQYDVLASPPPPRTTYHPPYRKISAVPVYGPAQPSGGTNVVPISPAHTGMSERKQRVQEVIDAMQAGKLTEAHARIYLAVERMVRREPDDAAQEAALKKLAQEHALPVPSLRRYHAQMVNALHAYRRQENTREAPPSDINLHQARTVRP